MHKSVSRAFGTAAAATTLTLLGAGVASAHVSVDAPGASQGGYAVATFKVPTESDTASTTKVSVALPNLKSARTEPLPGWSSKVDKNDKGEAVTVTWTADPGNAGVAPGQFQRFVLSVALPKQEKVTFPATQTYSDGKVVVWDQQDNADGSEPEHPAPALTLAAGGGDDDHAATTTEAEASKDTDNTARWLGGIGLILGALGAALGLGSVLRSRKS
ncbi:YcnI family protein [Nocardia sp. NBC_01503]|uniref:YcnI family copper-binding membrane protein n=1 Tax=Nocardia sp. NBC_01503 TaxID=2975997 RepID=UPI002E7BFD71|nr:YcnI family protein [Nocardia sp. NBC_01503]WTL34683.1 YcnI family protein [Nocardia sp. NBC_01503]